MVLTEGILFYLVLKLLIKTAKSRLGVRFLQTVWAFPKVTLDGANQNTQVHARTARDLIPD